MHKKIIASLALVGASLTMTACDSSAIANAATQAGVSATPFSVVSTRPHATNNFTQGLQQHGDILLETTGLRGASRLIAYDKAGNTLRSVRLPHNAFGEGVATDGKRIWVLTYTERKIYVYDFNSFTLLNTLTVKDTSQLWGACMMGDELVTSNGTGTLTFRNPNTGAPIRTVKAQAYTNINELECLPDGTILANIFTTSLIVRMDAKTGKALNYYNIQSLWDEQRRAGITGLNSVPNGVTVLENGNLLVTGKNWNKSYEITR